jgi:PKD repeat protein
MYTVSLIASNSYGNTTKVKTNYIAVGVPVAAFSGVPTLVSAGQSVQFTDASSGTPTNWNWTFGDGNQTTGTQNPLFQYNVAGTYAVSLNVSNAYGYGFLKKVAYITVLPYGSPIASFAEGTSGGTPGVLVAFTDTSYRGGNATTNYTWNFGDNLGTQPISYVNGSTAHVYAYAGTFTPTLTLTNLIGSNTYIGPTITVSTNQNTQNTWWTPHTVQITIMDTYGARLTNVLFNAQYNQSAMPTTWVQQMYGIQQGPGADLLNQSLVMSGITGSDGTITFTMLGSLKYDIYLNSATYGLVNYHVSAFPSDSMLNIYIVPAGQALPTNENNTYVGLSNTSVYIVEPNNTWINECINYQDLNQTTLYVNESWYFLNNYTPWFMVNVTPTDGGLKPFLNCNMTQNVRGTQTWFGYRYTRGT